MQIPIPFLIISLSAVLGVLFVGIMAISQKRRLWQNFPSAKEVHETRSRNAALELMGSQFEVSLTPGREVQIQNVSGAGTRLIKVKLGMRMANPSEYELNIQQIRWDLWLGPMVKAFSNHPGIVLKARKEVQDYVIEDALLEQDYVELVRLESKEKPVGYLEGTVVCRTGFGVFEKKFKGFNLSYDRRGGIGNIVPETQSENKENTDSLTGFLQRRFIEEQFQNVIDANIQNAPVAFIMIDVDHFKKFNDTHGHIIGDEILKTVCSKIKEILGSNGLPVRYGGDEFCVILEGFHAEEAEKIARAIHRKVGDTPLKTPEGDLRISLSIGVAALYHPADYKELIKKADKVLYESKRNGRDQVTADLRRD